MRIFLVICLSLVVNSVFAACPSAADLNKQDICVMNNMDQELLYSQYPNDFGTFGVPAHGRLIPSEADRNVVEDVILGCSKSDDIFKHFKIGACSGKVFYNKNYTKVLVEVVRGCQ